MVSRRGDSKDDVLELKLMKNQIEITAKNSNEEKRLSRLAVAGSLKVISKAQWCLRVGSVRSVTTANLLSTVLNQVLGVEPQPPLRPPVVTPADAGRGEGGDRDDGWANGPTRDGRRVSTNDRPIGMKA